MRKIHKEHELTEYDFLSNDDLGFNLSVRDNHNDEDLQFTSDLKHKSKPLVINPIYRFA